MVIPRITLPPKYTFCERIPVPRYIHGPLGLRVAFIERFAASTHPHPKRHLDQFIRFCRAHSRDQQTDTLYPLYSIGLSSRVTRSVVCVFVCVLCTRVSPAETDKTDRDSVSGVGLSVRGTHVDYTKCMLPVAWLDPPLTALRYVMYFRFYG